MFDKDPQENRELASEFSPKFVSEILNDSDESEYIEDFRERFSASKVFEDARYLQLQLRDTVFPLSEVNEHFHKLNESAWYLTAQAMKEKLIDKVVYLSGDKVEIPKLEVSETGTSSRISFVNEVNLDDETIEEYYETKNTEGSFAGFSAMYYKVDDDKVALRLTYLVTTDCYILPNAKVSLEAVGVIGESELVFEEDRKKDDVALMLNKLFNLCPDESYSIGRLSTMLDAKSELNHVDLRQIGYLVDKIIDSTKPDNSEKAEYLLIDLVKEIFDASQGIDISSTILGRCYGDDGKKFQLTKVKTFNDKINIQILPDDLVFRKRNDFNSNNQSEDNRKMLCFATYGEDGVYYVPFEYLSKFKRL